jgi:hypothetical protein
MMEDQKEDSTTDALLKLNSLKYSLPENLSVVTARQIQRYPSLSQDHAGGASTIYFRAETGARFCDGRNSWVRLQLSVTATTAYFASGSIANCIRSVVIRSASGTELDRVQNFNVLNRNMKRWSCPPDFFSGPVGTLQGFDDSATDLSAADSYYYIPLAELSGFFANSKLIPSMVMSGLQIELELESPAIAFKSTGAPTYSIQDCALFTDTFQLSDSIARKMNQLAATGGLELSYVASASTFTSGASSQDRFSINANLSVSRALHAFAVEVPTSHLTATEDSFNTGVGSELNTWQFRVGSQYFPTAPVTGMKDSLISTLYSWDKIRNCNASSSTAVDYASFMGYATPTTSQRNCAAVGTTLERSSVLNLSGIPINQSRALVLDINYSTAVARTIHMFVSYQMACTVFLNSVVVKQ